ncbi:hypothetical protein [Pseudomonas graminis]|uniref:Threonyl/alanyl tRNA synthetase SAD domain-containing protein n=1 Tax=Pseudomonas graminis TaxID=158627 RepID=A0A1C2DRN8_9PSED|nr:hypothetical protein [Pseudomonas graminis]OCX17430.1 hypothetical protein BBI10_18150 [Pseudomonas graminis]
MNERIYFDSDALELTTSVLSCSAREDGRYQVVLAATLFHPQGGGQPSDSGTIDSVNMLQALQSDDGIIHITSGPLDLGTVTLKVDGAARELHARYHSAGHLIACAGEKYGWLGLKGNHRPGESRVVFDPTDHARPVTEEMLQADVAALVAQNLPRNVDVSQGRRVVTWGQLPPTACGGTHVRSTGEVGEIHIVRVKQKKGQLSVQYELDADEALEPAGLETC